MGRPNVHSAAYQRFVASMTIGYMEWHDGIPYDLEALDGVTPAERRDLERRLVARRNRDWRDSEALGRLASPAAIEALRSSLRGSKREVRLRAGEILREKGLPVDLDSLVIEGLRNADIGEGFSQATDLAARFPSPAIEKTLLQGARCAPDRAPSFAHVLLHLHGQAKARTFDVANQAFCRRFVAPPGAAREQVFGELCARIGVDPASVSCSPPFPRAKPSLAMLIAGGVISGLGALPLLLGLGILAVILWRCARPLADSSAAFQCLLHC